MFILSTLRSLSSTLLWYRNIIGRHLLVPLKKSASKKSIKIPLVIVFQRIRVSGEIEHFDLDKNASMHNFNRLYNALVMQHDSTQVIITYY